MQKVSLSNKVFTENPLLDEIVYNARQLATGTVLKDEDRANNNENVESMQNGDVLIAINNGTITFENFHYDEDILSEFVFDDYHLHLYAANNSLIDTSIRPALLKRAIELFEEGFIEKNNYYRMLHGDPKYIEETDDIWDGLWIDSNYIDSMTVVSMDNINTYKVNEDYVQIHTLPLANANMLYTNGTCDNIVSSTDRLADWGLTRADVEYVLHIGDRSIDYYTARAAEKFALLYCPPCDSEEVKRRYKDLIEANRLYLLYTSYSEAYKYRSDYYDNFMMIFIIIQTIIDMVVELPEYIIRRDIFDARTCKYIFESNGVKYFRDIPLKYQVSLVKNLNKLIKFKSTDKCIIDITSIFGTENIEIFRYYIMKDRLANKIATVTEEGIDVSYEYYNGEKIKLDEEGNPIIVPDNENNYDIKFIKVPISGKYDDYIRTDSNVYGYDSVIDGDDYWIGDQDYETVKNDIKDLDFTVLRSKYYSIEAVIDVTKRNFTLIYFMNMLMYNNIDKKKLLVNLPNISTIEKFELVDTILALYALTYIYYGVEDTILDSRAKVAQILGFNLQADLAKIAAYLKEYHGGLTFEDLHVEKFTVPAGGEILTFNELQNIYLTNKDCHDHVKSMLTNPPSKEIYDAYKYIYDAMFVMNRNLEYFIVDDESGILKKYRDEKGYKVKFVHIIKREEYQHQENFERDWKWLLESMDFETLYIDLADDFDTTHKLDVYTKSGWYLLEKKGTVTMADTYRNFLRSKSASMYSYLQSIASIPNVDSRQEACINAIQSITSYLKDYIDQDIISLDTVLSGVPSISLDFIKKYVEEVIDFFKSFKIFTQGSSIVYLFHDKYENTVKLIEHVLIKYLLDKSEIVKIEDIIGGKVKTVGNKVLDLGDGLGVKLSSQEKYDILDKVWFSIDTWITKNYNEYYNSDKYSEYTVRIRDYMDRISTKSLDDEVVILDMFVKVLLDIKYCDKVELKESYNSSETRSFNEYYNEWLADIMYAFNINVYLANAMRYQDDIISNYFHDLDDVYKIIDGRYNFKNIFKASESVNISDNYYSIITRNGSI